ncbi:MAG: hypothetical protein WA240_00650 [Nitrospirota bacterium]
MNVLDIWFFLITAVLLPFAISRPVISGRNYIVLMVVVPFIIGALLIPYSLELEGVDYPAVKKASWLICIALISFLITVILLYRIKKRVFFKEEINRFALDILHRWEQTSNARLFIILFLFSLLGFLVLMLTFFKTGNIPYLNTTPINTSAKYFEGFTDAYIPLRPFYTAGQQLLAIMGFIILLSMITAADIRRVFLLLPLYIFTIIPLIATMKRGEITFSLITVFGGIILSRRVSKSVIITAAVILPLALYIAVMADPLRINRPFLKASSLDQTQEAIKETPKVDANNNTISAKRSDILRVLVNAFGIQIRDSARLIYNFEHQEKGFYKGKTFIAGLLCFIPTAYFAFKEEYQIGRVTLRLFGLNPETSGGPRVGLAGEAYINFWYFGVILIPIIAGFLGWYLSRLLDDCQKIQDSRGRIFLVSLYFFLLNHLVVGFFGDGSAVFQTFIIRTAIMAVVFFLLFYPVRRAKTL